MKLEIRNINGMNTIWACTQSLELYIDMFWGCYDRINDFYRFRSEPAKIRDLEKDERVREYELPLIRSCLMPELADDTLWRSNRGIFADFVDPRARDAYDILQVLRYTTALHFNPDGGTGVSFRSPMFSNQHVHPRATCQGNQNKAKIIIDLCEEQYQVMIEAMHLYTEILEGRIRDLFIRFTDNPALLWHAVVIENNIPHTIETKYLREVKEYARQLLNNCEP